MVSQLTSQLCNTPIVSLRVHDIVNESRPRSIVCFLHSPQNILTGTACQQYGVRMNGFAGIELIFAWFSLMHADANLTAVITTQDRPSACHCQSVMLSTNQFIQPFFTCATRSHCGPGRHNTRRCAWWRWGAWSQTCCLLIR